MRTFLIVGVCLSIVSVAACGSSDKGGKGTTTDASTGGTSTGGTSTGGTSSGGTAGVGTGGGGTGGTAGSDSGAGGALTDSGTGGAAVDAAPSCAPLQACCTQLTGAFADACNTYVATNSPTSCVAAQGVFCGGTPLTADGGGRAPTDAGMVSDGGDAGLGGCLALSVCCAALPQQGGQRAQCIAVVDNGVNSACNLLIPFLCP